MPYFVYQVTGALAEAGALELLGEFAGYREARTCARARRAELGGDPGAVRLVFSETAELAEALLRAPRAAPTLREWEK